MCTHRATYAHIADRQMKRVQKQCPDRPPTGPHLAAFYLALLIGRDVDAVFAIVAVSFHYSSPLCASLQHAALGKTRVLVRRALFRAQRRGDSAARRQRLIRRGASLHRIHGAASQALQRGPVARPQARYRASRRPWSAPVLIRRGGAPSFKRPLMS